MASDLIYRIEARLLVLDRRMFSCRWWQRAKEQVALPFIPAILFLPCFLLDIEYVHHQPTQMFLLWACFLLPIISRIIYLIPGCWQWPVTWRLDRLDRRDPANLAYFASDALSEYYVFNVPVVLQRFPVTNEIEQIVVEPLLTASLPKSERWKVELFFHELHRYDNAMDAIGRRVTNKKAVQVLVALSLRNNGTDVPIEPIPDYGPKTRIAYGKNRAVVEAIRYLYEQGRSVALPVFISADDETNSFLVNLVPLPESNGHLTVVRVSKTLDTFAIVHGPSKRLTS